MFLFSIGCSLKYSLILLSSCCLFVVLPKVQNGVVISSHCPSLTATKRLQVGHQGMTETRLGLPGFMGLLYAYKLVACPCKRGHPITPCHTAHIAFPQRHPFWELGSHKTCCQLVLYHFIPFLFSKSIFARKEDFGVWFTRFDQVVSCDPFLLAQQTKPSCPVCWTKPTATHCGQDSRLARIRWNRIIEPLMGSTKLLELQSQTCSGVTAGTQDLEKMCQLYWLFLTKLLLLHFNIFLKLPIWSWFQICQDMKQQQDFFCPTSAHSRPQFLVPICM